MIDEQTVVDYIKAQTSYTHVSLAEDTIPNLQDIVDLPQIFAGYASIDSKDPNVPIEHTLFNTNGEDLVQTFEIHIISSRAAFRATWITLYNTLIGWNPIPLEKYHSGFTYAFGGKMGRSHGKIIHVDAWRIGFPTNYILT